MVEGSSFSIYVHLTPTSKPQEILETVKLEVKATQEGSSNQYQIGDIAEDLLKYLKDNRDDGNKVYSIQSLSTEFGGSSIDFTTLASSVLEPAGDLFVTLQIDIDTQRHVKPLAVETLEEKKPLKPFKTLSKYTYYESGSKYVKVLLSELAGLKEHPSEKIEVNFGERSFEVKVYDLKGQNVQFSVPKLQCRILPKDCSFSHKSSGL